MVVKLKYEETIDGSGETRAEGICKSELENPKVEDGANRKDAATEVGVEVGRIDPDGDKDNVKVEATTDASSLGEGSKSKSKKIEGTEGAQSAPFEPLDTKKRGVDLSSGKGGEPSSPPSLEAPAPKEDNFSPLQAITDPKSVYPEIAEDEQEGIEALVPDTDNGKFLFGWGRYPGRPD
ncbi:hypothetical protein U1Q18_040735 [Sarracenia purpurea var. burkii]